METQEESILLSAAWPSIEVKWRARMDRCRESLLLGTSCVTLPPPLNAAVDFCQTVPLPSDQLYLLGGPLLVSL